MVVSPFVVIIFHEGECELSAADTTKALNIAKVIELLNKKSPHGGLTLK